MGDIVSLLKNGQQPNPSARQRLASHGDAIAECMKRIEPFEALRRRLDAVLAAEDRAKQALADINSSEQAAWDDWATNPEATTPQPLHEMRQRAAERARIAHDDTLAAQRAFAAVEAKMLHTQNELAALHAQTRGLIEQVLREDFVPELMADWQAALKARAIFTAKLLVLRQHALTHNMTALSEDLRLLAAGQRKVSEAATPSPGVNGSASVEPNYASMPPDQANLARNARDEARAVTEQEKLTAENSRRHFDAVEAERQRLIAKGHSAEDAARLAPHDPGTVIDGDGKRFERARYSAAPILVTQRPIEPDPTIQATVRHISAVYRTLLLLLGPQDAFVEYARAEKDLNI